MLKKFTAILLSITLLLTLCPSFTGVLAAAVYQTENFDGAAVGNYAAFNSLGLTDTLSTDSTEEIFKIVEGVGADGETTKMLEMKSPTGSNAVLKFPAFNYTTDAGVDYTFSYKFYLEKIPAAKSDFTAATGTFLEMFRASAGFYFSSISTLNTDKLKISVSGTKESSTSELLEKTWYKAEYAIQDASSTSGGYVTRSIYNMDDDKMNSNYPTSPSRQYKSSKEYNDIFVLDLKQVSADGKGFVVRIDDVEFRSFNPTTDGATIRKSTIANGSSVSAGTTEATIVFDQVLNAASVKLTSGGAELTAPTLTYVSNTLNTATYTLSGLSLEEGTDYTLDFSGCKNASGIASSETISFSTQSGGALTITSNSLTDGADISPIGATATVTFDQPLSGDSKVVVYEEGGQKLDCTLTPTSDTSYIVTLPELEEDKTYMLDFTGCKNANGVACTTKISLKTWITDMIKYADSFETPLIDDTKTGYKGYNYDELDSSPLYSSRRSSDLGTISTVAGYKSGNALQIATTEGYAGGSHISALNTHKAYMPVLNPDTNQYEQFVLTYRFRIDKAADYNTTCMIDGNGDGAVEQYTTTGTNINFYSSVDYKLNYDRCIARIINSEDKLLIKPGRHATWELNSYYQPEMEENKWYNIVWVVDGNKQTFNLIDTETGKMTFTCSAELDIPEGGHIFNIFNGNWSRKTTDTTITNQNQTVLIDDFTLWSIKPWETKQKLDLASEATVSDNEVTFDFNQPVLAKMNMLNVTKGSNEKAYSIPTITYTDFCTNEVSFSNLMAGQSYTVDYSAAKGVSGAAFADDGDNKVELAIANPDKAVSLNLEATGAKAGDTVTFDFWAEEAGETTFIAAFYDKAVQKDLVGVEIAKSNVTVGKNPITITLKNDHSAKAQEVKIFTWNNFTDIKPLTGAVKLPCSDTLKVLFIGNSLSEDANRHLNNVAALGGLELDLTVAGIGGSGLPTHAANLKAELAGRTWDEAMELINAKEYEYMPLYWIYDNGVGRGTSYIYRERLLDMLTAKEYDVISLQQYDNYEDSGFSESLPYLTEQIRKLQPDAELVLYQTWSESYKLRESRSLLFDIIKAPANEKWAALTPQLVEGITEGDAPMRIIPAGTAFYVADEMYEIFGEKLPGNEGNTNEGTQDDNANDFSVATSLWRDKNHASYYGCYLADAVWFECLTGRKAPIGTVDAPAVPRPTATDITPEEHIERLEYLSDIAHGVVMARR